MFAGKFALLSIPEQVGVIIAVTIASIICWWFLNRRVWGSLKKYITIQERWSIVKSDPKALAIVMVGIYVSTAILVGIGFDRFIT